MAVMKAGSGTTETTAQQLLLDRLAEALPVLDEECLEALVQSAENLASSCRQDRMLDEARMLILEGGQYAGSCDQRQGKKE